MYFTNVVCIHSASEDDAEAKLHLRHQLESLKRTHIIFPFLDRGVLAQLWPDTDAEDNYIAAFSGSHTSVIAIRENDAAFYQVVSVINDIFRSLHVESRFRMPGLAVIYKEQRSGIVVSLPRFSDHRSMTELLVNIINVLETGDSDVEGLHRQLTALTHKLELHAFQEPEATKLHTMAFETIEKQAASKCVIYDCADKNRMETRGELAHAFADLVEVLDEYLGEDTSEGCSCERIDPGDAVHSAVVAIERHFSDQKLPVEGHTRWRHLLKCSRAEDFSLEGDARTFGAAHEFRKWACQQLDRVRPRALAMWREKLDFLQAEEAKAADPGRKFSIKKQIEETQHKIQELEEG
jgi:hypothetical protein